MVVTGEGGYEYDCKDGGEGVGWWLLICLFQFIFMVEVHGPWW